MTSKLEMIYLMNVALYLPTIQDIMTFETINTKWLYCYQKRMKRKYCDKKGLVKNELVSAVYVQHRPGVDDQLRQDRCAVVGRGLLLRYVYGGNVEHRGSRGHGQTAPAPHHHQ